MSKKLTFLAAAMFAVLIFTGCKSVYTSDGASGVPQVSSDHPGYAADFAIGETRVGGEATVNVLFGIFAWGTEGFAENNNLSFFSLFPSPTNYAKSAAVYDACQQSKSDVLVGTRYTVTIMDYWVFKTVTCEVAGYPATMSGVQEKHPYVIGDQLFWLAEKPTVVK